MDAAGYFGRREREQIGRRAEQRRVVGRGDLRSDVDPERVADHATLGPIERPRLDLRSASSPGFHRWRSPAVSSRRSGRHRVRHGPRLQAWRCDRRTRWRNLRHQSQHFRRHRRGCPHRAVTLRVRTVSKRTAFFVMRCQPARPLSSLQPTLASWFQLGRVGCGLLKRSGWHRITKNAVRFDTVRTRRVTARCRQPRRCRRKCCDW